MKTMKMYGELRRVKEQDTTSMVKAGWGFCPKKEWKDSKSTRPVEKPADAETMVKRAKKIKSNKKQNKGE